MIYFLVNNNYQYRDFETHLLGVNKNDVTLIEIPHTLDERENTGIGAVFRYHRSLQTGLMAQILNYLSSIKQIDRDIVPTAKDVLFFYTECELLNQYVAGRFKKNGARVYLIEDGGFATYVPFRIIDSEVLTVKETVKQFVYRLLPELSNIHLHKLNGHIFPWMPDACIDGVCLYKPVAIARNIPTHFLKRPFQNQVDVIQGRVIFLNENIYHGYQSVEDYFDGLEKIIDGLCNGFNEVLFKFHPRETDEWRVRIRKHLLSCYPSVIFIEENTAVEEIVDRYRPSVVASYFCAALLSLCERGIYPLYLYHLIPDIQKQLIFRETTSVLSDLGYNFVSSFSAIDSSFQANLLDTFNDKQAITLRELMANNP